jgi:hypothetical protein
MILAKAMAIAFKEWQVVCDALASGRQAILLRKGGIHEGREGFSFAHDSFYLFPTRFHAQLDQVREGVFQPDKEWELGDLIEIHHHVVVLFAVTLENWEQVAELLPYHIYMEQTIKERFDWSGKGMAAGSIHLALVKVSKLETPWQLDYVKGFGGCRSWVELPEPPEGLLSAATAVLEKNEFEEISQKIAYLAGGEIP